MSHKSFLTLPQLLLLAGTGFAASLTVDESSAASNIGASAAGEGFRISFIPGAIGNFTLMIHIADFNVDVDYAVTQGGNAVGSGALAAFGATSTYAE